MANGAVQAMEVVFGGIQVKQYTLISAAQTPENAVALSKVCPQTFSLRQLLKLTFSLLQYTFANTFFYIACLWGVKIAVNLLHIQLTQRIPHIHIWAVRTLYLLIFTWIVVYITYPLGCVPTKRHWEAPLSQVNPCPPILKSWDFVRKSAFHIVLW